MRRFFCLLAALGLGACAKPPEALVVKTFLLRDQVRDPSGEPMVRMEKERRLRGAVSMEERRQRLGQYYTLMWSDPEGAGSGEVEVRFEYRQGATASRVKHMSKVFASEERKGSVDFAVTGDDYFDGGRVLAWRATVSRGGRELAGKQSYLWE